MQPGGGSQWLGDAVWEWQGATSQERVCFIKLKTAIPVETSANGMPSPASVDALQERVSQLSVDGQYTAWAVKPKLRYIVWIDDAIKRAKALIFYPFERGA